MTQHNHFSRCICAILYLLGIMLVLLPGLLRAQPQPAAQEAQPSFLIFKYQHIVGKEIDDCPLKPPMHCSAHFQLDFTGSSIALDAEIQTGPAFQPISYSAKGGNSTRSFVDLKVSVEGKQATVVDNGATRVMPLPAKFFTLQEDAPFLAQQLLFAYWHANGKPASIALLPEGHARIRFRGHDNFLGSDDAKVLTRYAFHGVTWGDETVWVNGRAEIVAIVGADAEEDRIEVVRPGYEPFLKDFARRAAADAVADLEQAARDVQPTASGTFALVHATVIHPATGDFERDVTVLISDGKITAVGADAKIPAGTQVINAAGKFVLPGLWDTHAHFEQWEWGPAYLACGITTVRDVGNEIEFLVPVRESLNGGSGLGPRMHSAGLIDSDPGSLTSEHAEDAAAARAIVERYHQLGYEQIKIYQSLKPELIPVVTAEAHRLGMSVTGHIPTGTDALTAVRDGMDQINHAGFVTRVMRPQGATTVQADTPEAKAAVRLLLEHKTVMEPTLARSEFNGHPRRVPFGQLEPSVIYLPAELAVILNNAGVGEDREARAAAGFQAVLDTTRILHDAGVPILAGSDQVVPGFSLLRELELLVRAGLTPLEAIRAATTVPAKIFNVQDAGDVAPGQRADLVILDGNPLEDIRNIRRVHLTITGGKVYDPNVLRQIVDIRPRAINQ